MKKITSFFAMLLLFVLGASAQSSEFELKGVSVGGAVAEMTPNTWYFLAQHRGGSAHAEVGGLPQGAGFAYDTGVGTHSKKSNADPVADETSADVAAKYMVRFVESVNVDGAYQLQFGTGNWLDADLNITSNVYDAVDLNVYLINVLEGETTGPQEGHFAINKWNMADRLDNNSNGGTLAWWGTGELNSINGNNDWSIHEVVWVDIDPRDAALAALVEILNEYDNVEFVPGTAPGQYDPAAVEAFNNALAAAHDADGPDAESLTPEEIKALGQAIIDAYNACLATKVFFYTPNGYYHIVNALEFYENVEIPSEVEGGDPTTETIYPQKAMYADGTLAKWTTLDPSACPFLWKFEETPEHEYTITNMATDGGFAPATATSANITMAETGTVMHIEALRTEDDGRNIVALIPASQANEDYRYLHAGGHGGGAGKAGNIVAWTTNGSPASEWVLVQVSDEEAQAIIEAYEPIKNHDVLVAQWTEMKADAAAKLEIAKDISTTLYEDQPLVTDVAQLSSPYTETSEGSIEALLDGDTGTFWHSAWSAGSVAGGTHYLQVEMPDETVASAAMKFTRRNVVNDHITEWGIYGTNDAEAEKDACDLLAEVSTPWGSNTETVTSPVFPVGEYKYLRFYINNTYVPGGSTRGYAHMSEFQLYPAEVTQRDPNQYTVMGSIVTDLEAVLAAQTDLEAADVTIDEFNALKAAYDAFIAKFVDPAALRAKLEEVAPLSEGVVIGNNPGEWKDANCVTALTNAIAAATAYDQSADYTPAKSEEHINTLTSLAEGVPAAANQVQTGKWYQIHLATEAEYDAHGWGKNNMIADINEETGVTQPELFGKFLSVAQIVTDETNTDVYNIENINADEVALGQRLFFQDKEMEIQDQELSKWRFIAVGDTAYIIQNKATGMFLKAAGTSGAVTLNIHPTLFTQKAIGFGQNLLTGKTLAGANNNNLHAQRDFNTLVTWSTPDVGSNSGLYIVEVEDVAADYDGTEYQDYVLTGEIGAYCYPVSVTPVSNDVVLYGVTLNETEVTLSPLKDNTAAAGQPFMMIAGSVEDYNAEAEAADYDLIQLKHGYEIAKEPATMDALVGTYDGLTIGTGKIVPDGNKLVVTKKTAAAVGQNGAYIAAEEDLDVTDEVTLVISSEEYDAITSVEEVSKNGNIYTIDGRLVGNGNINAIKNMGRGIYILNGVKVAVK
ncbi:MAG: discoidin domain-containing protein [Bacteroidaceae bacterium]|nr:discoidin domain-containing protein [Bacteroidaceae bacterium]